MPWIQKDIDSSLFSTAYLAELQVLYLKKKKRVNWLMGFPDSSVGKDLGSIPGLGRSPGEGKGYPLQYSGLENFMDYIKSMWLQRVRHD